MATYKIFPRAIEIAIEEPVKNVFRQKAAALAEDKFQDTKNQFLINFASHPISQEIEAGEQVISDEFLPAETVGNLFSWIGFVQGTHPVKKLYDFLDKNIILESGVYDKIKKAYFFGVRVPSRDSIADATPMPWNTARSWVYGIESGIAGLNYYLTIQKANLVDQLRGRKRVREGFRGSFSTTAIQSKNIVSAVGSFTPQQYLTNLLKIFEKIS